MLKGTRKGDFCDSKACFVVFVCVPQVPECRRAAPVTGVTPSVRDEFVCMLGGPVHPACQ